MHACMHAFIHSFIHSFSSVIQQCHSARAARARTSDTRDTSQALHKKPPFLKCGSARFAPSSLALLLLPARVKLVDGLYPGGKRASFSVA